MEDGEMSRYPYTEAYDSMRAQTEFKPGAGVTFSRSEAAMVLGYIADAIGMNHYELACKIADHARALEEDAQ
jgi:hypothetical protein